MPINNKFIDNSNSKETLNMTNQYKNFKQIVNTFYNEEIDDISQDEEVELKNKGTVKLEPKIIYDKFSRRYASRVQNRNKQDV
ncbi:MAG: hypothetical protein HFJ36_00865 [Clostridia bacterium]|nr:hypothetical protein [Clostridia bacterium]